MWNYRFVRDKKCVRLCEVVYDDFGVPVLYSDFKYPIELIGYDHDQEFSGREYDEKIASENLVKDLKMILDDLTKNPVILDPEKDFTGEIDVGPTTPLNWEDLIDDDL